MTAYDLGHIITHYVNQRGDSVSHKKLQKLIYYVEAWHLVNFNGEPLVDEEFEAWVHGPVVPSLYHELKPYGFNDLKIINEEHETVDQEIKAIIEKYNISQEQLDLIYNVLTKYSSLSSLELEMLSHSEIPWIEARDGLLPHQPCNNKINKKRMLEFYSLLG